MATPTASLAYAELAPHSLHLAVLAGRKIVALRAFSLDAKADLAAFVAEHQLAGVVRASLLGPKNFLHRSAEAESGAVRQPLALQTHAGKLPHGFDAAPTATVCDAATGAALDPVRVNPWLLAAVDSTAFSTAKETLGTLGLAPADLTLAAPCHLGAVAASLSAGETALVLLPGDDEASLAWVSSAGVQAVASAPIGYARIFEAVQHGLGLKFRAAAGKLFYNDNYDFTDAAPKIGAEVAEALKPSLGASPLTHLHVVGLTPGQAWLGQQLAASLGLKVWSPAASALIERLGLESSLSPIPATAAGLISLAAAGSADAAWVPPTLETLIARPPARAKSAAPFAKPAAPAAAPAAAPEPAIAAPAPTPAPAPAAAKPAPAKAPAPASRPAAPKPAPKPVLKAAPAPAPQPVLAVAVEETPASAGSTAAPARKSNKGPIFIAGGVGLVALVVGLAAHFRSPKDRPETAVKPADQVETTPATGTTPTPAVPTDTPRPPTPPRPEPTPPTITPIPQPAVIDVSRPSNPATPVGDTLAADARKFANDRYRLEVTEKGFLQALATARDEVLVESAAGISLQGSYVGTDGRRKWFNVGGVDDVGYQASVKKSVRDGVTVFDVKVTHPRFELEQSFHCLADTVKVTAKFVPINLRDPRGVIAAVHSVRLSPVALNPSLRMRAAADGFAYAMKAGTLRVGFDNGVWARDGADGKQTIIAGENGVAFHFTESSDAARNTLTYEIAMP